MKTSEGEEMNAVTSELFRVFQAYSVSSGISRTASVHLIVSEINPAKSKEEELQIEDLLPLLKLDNPLGRVKVAELISTKAKRGSYKTPSGLQPDTRQEAN